MSEYTSQNHTLVDPQLWSRVGKSIARSAINSAMSVQERRRGKDPRELLLVGKDLLDYFVEVAPESGRMYIQTNALDVPQRAGGCQFWRPAMGSSGT